MFEVRKLEIERDGKTLKYDFKLKTGHVLAIQGLSGVGKSTLLSAVAGFVNSISGQILWEGQTLNGLSIDKRPVSYLFQQNNLFEHLSVMTNMTLGFGERPVNSDLLDQITDAAHELQVSDQLQKMPGALSGGQRQRIAIIRTMLRPEPLVLLDEPFAELDPQTRLLATGWVRKVAKKYKKTVLMVTHQSEDVEQVADSVLMLKQS
ncbi:ATP-binding cassette domain-containing protein [Sansalvadorimonas sp. 2012CJ34-2]|uniref:ATP-binding cassette domain-containing protein n=1 Tax=Parendozoicomonas callyspongiae TaxID=2942213 RepID=A0ABT0PHI7_9GAMM|nr:ATP-binding cassette domain-containing protein [Sansalvadorimonas sp. 2012CJ34-2]MCL6270803.1 ATP-binding cassette domain-containing protein [Sansalvadorimonas sp. 2012CJ34-2]